MYTGVTSNLLNRIYQHKNKLVKGFTMNYLVDKLGFYEMYFDVYQAIGREKQIKGGSRKKKLAFIEGMNPNWDDLYEKLV